MENLRCAVIGLGIGMHHLRGYQDNPRAEVVGLADLNAESLKKGLKEAPEAKGFECFEDLLRECKPQVVSVALPNFLHEPVTLACLEAGADVMCEKPLSISLASALRMEEAVRRTGKNIYMNLSQRFAAVNVEARRLVEAGALGEVYHGYTEWTRRDWMPKFGGWFGQKDLSGGGPLLDIGVHKIDLALWLMQRPKPVTVSGITHYQRGVPRAEKEKVKFDVEDYATGFIRFENGASLIFETSWAGYQQEYSQESFKLIGTRGGFEVKPGPNGLDTYYNHEVNGVPLCSRILTDKTHAPRSTDCLVDHLLDGRPFRANLEDGIRMQVILEALYESASRGKEINIKEEFPEAFRLL